MDIILGTDAKSQTSVYRRNLTEGLSRAWRLNGHQVIATHSLADSSQAQRLLKRLPDALPLLLSEGPVARSLADACAERGKAFWTFAADTPGSSRAATIHAEQAMQIHARAQGIFAASMAVSGYLLKRGLNPACVLPTGVDEKIFQPRVYERLGLPRPVSLLLSQGQQSDALRRFAELPLSGSKLAYVPGWTGPASLGQVAMFSYMPEPDQASLISAADVCIIGEPGQAGLLSALKSLACGVPFASLPNAYLEDLLKTRNVGGMDARLERAVACALTANRQLCRSMGRACSWQRSANLILISMTTRVAEKAA